MYLKIAFCIIDLIAIIDICVTIKFLRRIREKYSTWLFYALNVGALAIIANILIALSFNSMMADISYCMYFIAVDWIIFFLCAFCIAYTEPGKSLTSLKIAAICIMGIDSIGILLNPFTEFSYLVKETEHYGGTVFYQIVPLGPYYVHLVIDYLAVLTAFGFLIHGMVRSRSVYRVKYGMIIGVLMLVVALNIVYMAWALPLDISVIFYALAGTLIYFSITRFVPKSLLIMTTERAVDDMNDGIMLFDISGNCIYANQFAKLRFGINLNSQPNSLNDYPARNFLLELSENNTEYGSFRYKEEYREDNFLTTKFYEIKYNPLTDKNGNTLGSYFVIADRTENASYMFELNKAKEEADRANNAKSIFLANISHEIRTPLNSVLGMNDMILRSTRDPQLIEYAENIRTAGDTLLSLINDVLDFSKIEAGKMEIENAPYDPHQILKNVYTSFVQSADEKRLYLRFTADENMPRRLIGDSRHIGEILFNLVSNAVKYTRSGGVKIDMRVKRVGEKNVDLIISVEDTGIGIAKEDMKYLFESFKRINETQNASIQGTGLGLSILKETVEAMNGSIKVESEVGTGSTFTVTIPQEIHDNTPIGNLDIYARPKNDRYHESFHAPDACVLVVDDVNMNLKVMNALLKATMMKIETATSADQAIEMCKDIKYDLIFLDHRMPIKDGIEAFNEIRAEGLNTETPVIMLTANALSGADEEYLDMGFSGYLTKPVRAPELEAEIIRLLPPEKVRKQN